MLFITFHCAEFLRFRIMYGINPFRKVAYSWAIVSCFNRVPVSWTWENCKSIEIHMDNWYCNEANNPWTCLSNKKEMYNILLLTSFTLWAIVWRWTVTSWYAMFHITNPLILAIIFTRCVTAIYKHVLTFVLITRRIQFKWFLAVILLGKTVCKEDCV